MTENKTLTVYDACAVVEGFDGEEHTEQEIIEAWQYLLDVGAVWTLQGWYGRTATALLEQGLIHDNKKISHR